MLCAVLEVASMTEAEEKINSLCFYPPGGAFNKKRRQCSQHRLFQQLLEAHARKMYECWGSETPACGETRLSACEILSHFPGGFYYEQVEGQVTPLDREKAIYIVCQKLRDTRKRYRAKPAKTGSKRSRDQADTDSKEDRETELADTRVQKKPKKSNKNKKKDDVSEPEFQNQGDFVEMFKCVWDGTKNLTFLFFLSC